MKVPEKRHSIDKTLHRQERFPIDKTFHTQFFLPIFYLEDEVGNVSVLLVAADGEGALPPLVVHQGVTGKPATNQIDITHNLITLTCKKIFDVNIYSAKYVPLSEKPFCYE